MIRFAVPVHPDTGETIDCICPVIECDACGKIIDHNSPALLLWEPEDDRRQYHVHNLSRCAMYLSRQRGHTGRPLMSRDLKRWLEQLVENYTKPLLGSRFRARADETVIVQEARYYADAPTLITPRGGPPNPDRAGSPEHTAGDR